MCTIPIINQLITSANNPILLSAVVVYHLLFIAAKFNSVWFLCHRYKSIMLSKLLFVPSWAQIFITIYIIAYQHQTKWSVLLINPILLSTKTLCYLFFIVVKYSSIWWFCHGYKGIILSSYYLFLPEHKIIIKIIYIVAYHQHQ